jgi:cell division protein FtsB
MSTATGTRSAAPRPAERTRRKKKTARMSGAPRRYFEINGAIMVSIAAVALSIIGMLYLIQTSQVASLGYELSRMQERRQALALEISELKYELARYESLDTIDGMARGRLGMTPITNYEFTSIERPYQEELVVPIEDPAPAEPLATRVMHALFGVGSATSSLTSENVDDGSGDN